MITMVLFSAVISSVSLFLLLYKLSPKVLSLLVGYEFYVDLFFSLGLGLLFGLSGTVTGMLTGAALGISVSIGLILLRKFISPARIVRSGLRFSVIKL